MFYFYGKGKCTEVFQVIRDITPEVYCLIGKQMFSSVPFLHEALQLKMFHLAKFEEAGRRNRNYKNNLGRLRMCKNVFKIGGRSKIL